MDIWSSATKWVGDVGENISEAFRDVGKDFTLEWKTPDEIGGEYRDAGKNLVQFGKDFVGAFIHAPIAVEAVSPQVGEAWEGSAEQELWELFKDPIIAAAKELPFVEEALELGANVIDIIEAFGEVSSALTKDSFFAKLIDSGNEKKQKEYTNRKLAPVIKSKMAKRYAKERTDKLTNPQKDILRKYRPSPLPSPTPVQYLPPPPATNPGMAGVNIGTFRPPGPMASNYDEPYPRNVPAAWDSAGYYRESPPRTARKPDVGSYLRRGENAPSYSALSNY